MIVRFDLIALAVLAPAAVLAWRLVRPELWARALTLLGLLGVVTLALVLGRWGVFALAIAIGLGAAMELARAGGLRPPLALLAAAIGFALPLLGTVATNLALAAFVLAVAAMALVRRPVLVRPWFAFVLAGALLGVALGFLVRLDSLGAGAIILLVLVLQFNDGVGYAVGGRFGRTRPFPALSPGKSVEGYLAGGVGALIAVLLLATVDPVLRASAWPDLVAVGAVLVVTANAGDLLLSRLKRSAGLKDFGRLLPGHGGVLDRFDGWLVSTPVLFVLVSILPVLVARR